VPKACEAFCAAPPAPLLVVLAFHLVISAACPRSGEVVHKRSHQKTRATFDAKRLNAAVLNYSPSRMNPLRNPTAPCRAGFYCEMPSPLKSSNPYSDTGLPLVPPNIAAPSVNWIIKSVGIPVIREGPRPARPATRLPWQ